MVKFLIMEYFWHCADILSYHFKIIEKHYLKHYGKEYEKEIKKFNLAENKKILHIGCGSYPISAIVLSKIKNATITTIDKKNDSADRAKDIIKRKKLDKKIIILNEDGTGINVKNFDLIIISSFSKPMFDVLKNIFNKSAKNCKIVLRMTSCNKEKNYDFLKSYKKIKIIDELVCNPYLNASWISLLLVKK